MIEKRIIFNFLSGLVWRLCRDYAKSIKEINAHQNVNNPNHQLTTYPNPLVLTHRKLRWVDLRFHKTTEENVYSLQFCEKKSFVAFLDNRHNICNLCPFLSSFGGLEFSSEVMCSEVCCLQVLFFNLCCLLWFCVFVSEGIVDSKTTTQVPSFL